MKKFLLISYLFLTGCSTRSEKQVDITDNTLFENGDSLVRSIEYKGHQYFSSSAWGNLRSLEHDPDCTNPKHKCKCEGCGWK